jgi:hypothetical protein
MLPEPLGPAPTPQRCQESKRDIGGVHKEGKCGEKPIRAPTGAFTIEHLFRKSSLLSAPESKDKNCHN